MATSLLDANARLVLANMRLSRQNHRQAHIIDRLKTQVEERSETSYRIDAAHRQLDRVNGSIAAAANGSYVAITIQAVIIGLITTVVATAVSPTWTLLISIRPNASGVPYDALAGSIIGFTFAVIGFLVGVGRVLWMAPSIATRLRKCETARSVMWGFIDNLIRITAKAQSVLHA
jgi:hypothetical protein